MKSEDDRLLKPEEAAIYLGIALRRVRQMIARGELPVIVLGPRLKRLPALAAFSALPSLRPTKRPRP